jgi:WD40 repeat protein
VSAFNGYCAVWYVNVNDHTAIQIAQSPKPIFNVVGWDNNGRSIAGISPNAEFIVWHPGNETITKVIRLENLFPIMNIFVTEMRSEMRDEERLRRSAYLERFTHFFTFTLSLDGEKLAIATRPFGNRIGTWAGVGSLAAPGETIKLQIPDDGPRCTSAAWSPDGRQVAIGRSNGTVLVFDGLSGELRQQLSGITPNHGVQAVSWHPTGSRLAIGGGMESVFLWTLDISHEAVHDTN